MLAILTYTVNIKRKQRRTKKMTDMNPCLYCDCYDSDTESCTMPSEDRLYDCPLAGDGTVNYEDIEE